MPNTKPPMPSNSPLLNVTHSRRSFLRTAAKGVGAAALLGGLPRGWVGSVYASDAPETAQMKFGMIALTDCSPIVIAHEKGLFKKYGIESTVAKGANWAAIRDSLASGDNQATHMLLGMPIASTMGLLGSPKKPMVIPWMLNRNGQAITAKMDLKGKLSTDAKVLKPLVDKAKAAGGRLAARELQLDSALLDALHRPWHAAGGGGAGGDAAADDHGGVAGRAGGGSAFAPRRGDRARSDRACTVGGAVRPARTDELPGGVEPHPAAVHHAAAHHPPRCRRRHPT